MAFKRTNRWDVQVVFPGWMTRGLKNRNDVEQTYDSVIKNLDEFLREMKRSRQIYRRRLRKIANDPALSAKARRLGISLMCERTS